MKKILLAEDDRFIAKIYKGKLQFEGYSVDVAEDGNSVIQQLKNQPPDLVLLDLMLPEVDGVKILQFIRSNEALKNLPVVVLSNAFEDKMVQAAWKAGANKCLTKASCRPKQLIEEVRRALLEGAPVRDPDSKAESSDEGGELEPDQAASRAELLPKLPDMVLELQQLVQNTLKTTEANTIQSLYQAVRSLSGAASVSGLGALAEMSSALEAFLHHLMEKPKDKNPSTLRTLAQGADFLCQLCNRATETESPKLPQFSILVVDDEFVSRETICTALEKAHLRATSMEDSAAALQLLEQMHFDLVFLDVDMPEMNGLELCKNLRATKLNAMTPVVFVTGLTDFNTRAQSALSGGNDLIAKPIVLIELAVKALIHLLKGK